MLIQIITFLVVLTFLVFIHELGHFYTARKTGTKVEEFGLGLPPRIFGYRKNPETNKWEWVKGSKIKSEDTVNTIFSMNWLPIGGFVKIKGENEDVVGEDSFAAKSVGRRALMLSAGVIMNFLAAMALLAIAFNIGFPSIIEEDTNLSRVSDRYVQIGSVLENSPAAQANLQLDDELVSLDGVKPITIDEVQDIVSNKESQAIEVVVKRGDETVTADISPIYLEETQTAALGVGLLEVGTISYPIHEAIWRGVSGTGFVTVEIFKVIGRLISGAFTSAEVKDQIAGPVGIAVLTGEFVEMGFVFVLQFAALLSINLAIINILPFPALDGGRLLFVLIERVRRRPVSRKIENMIHTVGFVILIGLIIYVTAYDFSRFGSQILGAVRSIF